MVSQPGYAVLLDFKGGEVEEDHRKPDPKASYIVLDFSAGII